VRSRAEYEFEVASARRTARRLRVIAAITFSLGWVAVAFALLALAFEALPWEEAENLLWVLGFGSVVSGVAMFATSWSLQIGASRMEIDLASKLP
jgi:drug/metabolite transporter (DMT)-like permease